jgi:hypothetical protein
VLGAILLYVGPRFAKTAFRTAVSEPLRTGGVGLAGVLAVAMLVFLLALSIIGLPLAVGLLLLAIVFAWIAAIYGRYIVGEWLLSFADVDNRYLALLVGAVVVGLLGLVPYLGTAVQTVVFLLGAGVVVLATRRLYELVSESRSGLADL